MTQALYRKWRPQSWDEMVGQEHIVQTLRNAVRGERVAHAYLFAGPRGTGKTTAARLLAKAVNCTTASAADRPCNACSLCQVMNAGRFMDLIEIDAASNTSVEDVRDLRDKINFSPGAGRYKVYIVDEVHMLSTAAFNALLKTLEEPPPHAIFILATTEVHKVPATVLSRCQRHEFRRLSVDAIVGFLQTKLKEEGLEAEAGVLEMIARQATGSLRDAISLLDQLASAGDVLSLAQAETILGTATTESVTELAAALFKGDLAAGLTVINRALDGGSDPRQFARQVVDYLRGILLVRMGNPRWVEVTAEARAGMQAVAEQVEVPHLLAAIRSFNRAATEGRAGWQPSLPLELALMEAVQAESAARGNPSPEQPNPGPTPASSPSAKPMEARAAPAPATEDAAASAPKPAPTGEITFQHVLDRWRDILAAARRHDPRTQALLNSSRPLGLEGGVLVLGFASDLLRDKMDKGHSMDLAKAALREVLGKDLGIRSALSTGPAEASTVEDPGPAVGQDGMVAAAMKDLGAQVVDVRPILPEERARDV